MAARSRYSDMTNHALTKLCLAADYYADISPAISRFYTDKVDRLKDQFALPPTANHLRCQFCGTVFRPNNHRLHIKTQMKETKKIRQLLRHQEKPGKELGRFQRQLLDLYMKRKNRLTIFCEVCNKRTYVWFPAEREKGTKVTCDDTPVPDMSNLSRSAKKKLKKKLKKKQQQSDDRTVVAETTQQTTTATLSTPRRSCEPQNRLTPSSRSHGMPLSTPRNKTLHAASSQSKKTAMKPLLDGLNCKSARNKKKRNKQSYNPLKEMLERQTTNKHKTSGKGIMDLLIKINQ